ncbi:Fanconi anemia group D2 protein, partial [Coemansia biformis]
MLVDSSRHHSWAFVSMTYDELAHIVETKGLHLQLLTWLHENVSSTFAAQFLSEADALDQRYLLPGPPAVALSLDDSVATVLDVFNHNGDAASIGLTAVARRPDAPAADADMDVDAGETPQLRGCVLACLPSLLRLIQVCEKALDGGSLGEIDALLVCGAYLMAPADVSLPATAAATAAQTGQYVLAESNDPGSNASQVIAGNALVGADEDARVELISAVSSWPLELRRVLCTSVYAMVNWVREIINAFADQPSAEIRANVIQRINQLPQLESDLEALVASLRSTASQFDPAAAGLVPDISGAPTARAGTGGPTLRAFAPGARGGVGTQPDDQDVAGQPRPEHDAMHMVDVGGLLLSQDDTRKLVSGNADALEGDPDSRKRGRKRKSAGGGGGGSGAAPAADDPARNLHPFLRELSFSAFDVLRVVGGGQGDDEPPSHGPLLSARGLRTLLRELHAVVSAKLISRSERRLPWLKNSGSNTTFGALATFSSNISGSTAADVSDRLLPIFPSLLGYLDSCLATRARFRNDVEVTEQPSARDCRIAAVDTLDDVDAVESCVDTLLLMVSSVLSWDGLQSGLRNDSSSTA